MHESKPALEKIGTAGLVLVVRAHEPEKVTPAIEAMIEGGVKVVEVGFAVPRALEVLEHVVAEFGEQIVVGAGTVLHPSDAAAAVSAGAKFVASPNVNTDVVTISRVMGAVDIPGALTPSEIIRAWEAGADCVKIFPAGIPGADYMRLLHGPFPEVRLVAAGGVTLENLPAFFKAGAFAVCVGTDLMARDLLEKGDFASLRKRAASFVDAVRKSKEE